MSPWHRRLGLAAWGLAVLLLHQWGVAQFSAWQPVASAPPPRLSVQLVQRASVRSVAPVPAPPRARQPAQRPRAHAAALAPVGPASAALTGAVPSDPAASATVALAALASLAPAALDWAASAVAAQPAASKPASAASAARAGDSPGPEWPLSTQLRYSLVGDYSGPVHGDAEVEWLRQGTRYQVRLRVAVGPKYAPFLQRRLSSDGLLTANGIAPRRYDEETQLLWRSGQRASVLMDGQQVRLAQGQWLPAPAGVQDSASQFVHLTWLMLTGREPSRAGHVISLPVALPQQISPWRYEVVGEEVVTTRLGPLPTWHLRPLPPHPPGALVAEVWLAPGFQYLPAQIRIAQDKGVWVLLTLAEAPLQEAPPENRPQPPGDPRP